MNYTIHIIKCWKHSGQEMILEEVETLAIYSGACVGTTGEGDGYGNSIANSESIYIDFIALPMDSNQSLLTGITSSI